MVMGRALHGSVLAIREVLFVCPLPPVLFVAAMAHKGSKWPKIRMII